MKGNYIFEYFDEIKFKKCERSLKKYNMFAFKKLIFELSQFNQNFNFAKNIYLNVFNKN